MEQSMNNDLEETGENAPVGLGESKEEEEENEEKKNEKVEEGEGVKDGEMEKVDETGELERRVEDVRNSNTDDERSDEHEGRRSERHVSDEETASSGFEGRTLLKDKDDGDEKTKAKSTLARDTDSGVVEQIEDMVTPDLPNQETSGNDLMSQITVFSQNKVHPFWLGMGNISMKIYRKPINRYF